MSSHTVSFMNFVYDGIDIAFRHILRIMPR